MEASIKKIILATDFSDIAKHAGLHAFLLAQTFKAELIVLHVFDPSKWSVPTPRYYLPINELGIKRVILDLEKTKHQGEGVLKELAKSLDPEAETIFTEGDPGHEIIRVAEERSADLVVLGTHGYTGWKRFALGSVAEIVVRHAPCPVLTIRPKENK